MSAPSVSMITLNRPLAKWLECSPMAQETGDGIQRLKKWYLMLPCLTFSIIR